MIPTILGLLGCASLDVPIEDGDYTLTEVVIGPSGSALNMSVDRTGGLIHFFSSRPSSEPVAFSFRSEDQLPLGCPRDGELQRLEVMDIGVVALELPDWTIVDPLLMADCSTPGRVVLMDEGSDEVGTVPCDAASTVCLAFQVSGS